MSSHGDHVKWCVCGAVSALTVCLAASSRWFVFEAPWLSPPAPMLVNSVEGAEELLEDLVYVSDYFVHTLRFSVSAAVLAAIFVGVCGSALVNFLLQGMVRLWRCPLRFQLFPFSALIAPSVQGCFESTKIPGKGSRIVKEVWVWLTLSQVVCAEWAAAAFAFGYLEFVFDASAVAASAGAWNVFLLLEGVYGAAAATVGFITLGGDYCFFGAAVAHSSVCSFWQAAAKEGLITLEGYLWCLVADCLICTLLVFTDAVRWPTVIAGYNVPSFSGKVLFGILEVCWRVISSRDSLVNNFFVLDGQSYGVDTVAFFAFAEFFEAREQAAAAGGHYASEAKATPRVDVGDPLRRQASIRQWDRTKLKVKKVPKHKSSKSLSRTWLERRWWCGVSSGWTRCLWSSVKLSRLLVFFALCSTWLVPLVVGFRKMSLWSRVGLGPTPLCS